MVFSSISFLYLFLPTVIILYYAVPQKLKNYLLLLSSLVFYYIGGQKLIWIMLVSITLNYLSALLIEKMRSTRYAKPILVVSVILNLALLGYYKYFGFFAQNINSIFGDTISIPNIVLPIGISFFTFQAMSYTVDVYRGTVSAAKNPCTVGAYVTLFPQLIAGPIVRYSEVEKELKSRTHSLSDFSYGVRRFCIGLGKKVLLANNLAALVKTATYTDEKTVLLYWMSAVAFTLQIYFDFSGYSDMAIGLCRMFGFHIGENFKYPFISSSITEFWRRWHISLGTWFRDYVYIPLGGNRVKKYRWFINITVVWFLTGLWHGAAWNFVLWGASYGVLLIIEKLFLKKHLDKLPKCVGLVYTLFFTIVGFTIFNASSISEAGQILSAMFGTSGLALFGEQSLYLLRSYAITFLIAFIASTPLSAFLGNKYKDSLAITIAEPICAAALLIISTGYLIDGSFNPFIYFRF